MYDSPKSAAVECEVRPVPLSIEYAAASLQRAHDRMDRLVDKLDSTLSPGPNEAITKNGNTIAPVPNASSLARTINALGDDADRLANRISSLIDRVEL